MPSGAIARWTGPIKLDFTGQLVDGGKFDGTSQLRQQLMRYSPRFVQALTERLLVMRWAVELRVRTFRSLAAWLRARRAKGITSRN